MWSLAFPSINSGTNCSEWWCLVVLYIQQCKDVRPLKQQKIYAFHFKIVKESRHRVHWNESPEARKIRATKALFNKILHVGKCNGFALSPHLSVRFTLISSKTYRKSIPWLWLHLFCLWASYYWSRCSPSRCYKSVWNANFPFHRNWFWYVPV